MKRILFGILWFIVSWLVLTLVYGIIFGIVIAMFNHSGDYQQGMQASLSFQQAHPTLVVAIRLLTLLAAILIAVVGTWKGFLPGTRRKAPVSVNPGA